MGRVLVQHTDRLRRGSRVQDLILDALRRHGVELWDFGGLREQRSAGGRFALKVLGAAAELEKNLTGERIVEMKRGKARAGKVGGGPPPFGYASQSRVIAMRRFRATGMNIEQEVRRCKFESFGDPDGGNPSPTRQGRWVRLRLETAPGTAGTSPVSAGVVHYSRGERTSCAARRAAR